MTLQNQDELPSGATSGTDENALGEPIQTFRAKAVTPLVITACGFVILGGGIWLLVEMGALGPGPWVMTFGLVVLTLAYAVSRSSYVVCRGGILRVRFGRRDQCPWNIVCEILDKRTTQGLVTSRTCVVVTKNGGQLVLSDFVGDFESMLALIRKQADELGIPWKEVREAGRG